MTRNSFTWKNFFSRLLAVILFLTVILSATSASALGAGFWDSNENPKTVYITWQPPIPPSEKGDCLTMSVGVLVNEKTYASQDVFDVLDIPSPPKDEGKIITVDGISDVYYPLRKSAEEFGYSVLWAPKSVRNGKVIDYWVYIAKSDAGSNWIQVVDNEVPEVGYNYYGYYYVYSDDCKFWWSVSEDEIEYIPKENAIIVK